MEDSELEKRSGFLDILKNARRGDTVMIHAPAGFGKSSLLCHTTIEWQNNNSRLDRYQYLYLLQVRKIKNHAEVLERVLTRDLNLLDEAYQAKVRMSLKFSSEKCLILIDGFDEMNDDVKEYTVLNELLRRQNMRNLRDFIKNAVVVVTTRPNCREHILQKTQELIDLPLNTLDKDDVKSYVNQMFGDKDKADKVHQALLGLPAPGNILYVPLFLGMLCCLCYSELEKFGNLSVLSDLRTTSSILKTFWKFMLEIKHLKASSFQLKIASWKSKRETDDRVNKLAKLCFHCLERGVYVFSQSLLKAYNLCLDDLTELGPIDVTTTGDNAGASFIHASFQEYCAGMYIADNNSVLRKVLEEWRGGRQPTELFLRYKNALIYSVGIDNNILSKVPSQYLTLTSCNPMLIDLRLESKLLHECSNRYRRLKFLDRIKASPVKEATYEDRNSGRYPDLSRSAYDTLVSDLGHSGCLEIVKRVYTERDPHNPDLIVLPEDMRPGSYGIGRRMTIADPLLLPVLSHISLSEVTRLSLDNISPVILKILKRNKVMFF